MGAVTFIIIVMIVFLVIIVPIDKVFLIVITVVIAALIVVQIRSNISAGTFARGRRRRPLENNRDARGFGAGGFDESGDSPSPKLFLLLTDIGQVPDGVGVALAVVKVTNELGHMATLVLS